jgi:alkanesulfonate monooxygenase SsuD/methylene tetrahydromethanopterin reductase-like flavin-dependent oxidoreductase (luciferase family)
VEEQVHLLRQLWTQPLVEFSGHWHTVPDAGINPLPAQRPIPIWFGGHADAVLRRVARLGDGWLPLYPTPEQARPALEQLDGYLAEDGRTRAEVGIEPRMSYGSGDPDAWIALIQGWQDMGATHLSVNTMGCGLATAADHLTALRTFAAAIGLA